jgi:hypothetical protein
MSTGPHVFGDNRLGLWSAPTYKAGVYSASAYKDKLTHFLPRLRMAVPNLTDIFLPPEAGIAHKDQCRQANFFVHTYAVAHGMDPVWFAKSSLARRKVQGTGALELNFEGSAVEQMGLFDYVTQTIAEVRRTNPNLPVRINVVPFKGQFLPRDLIVTDPNLFVIAQTYGGNMEILYAADEVKRDLTAWGIPEEKVSVQHAVMCSGPYYPRQITLPVIRGRASLYIDDLLLDAGLLP